jgi:hypothetical protein
VCLAGKPVGIMEQLEDRKRNNTDEDGGETKEKQSQTFGGVRAGGPIKKVCPYGFPIVKLK